jgi:putative intracellular protease/amidase
VLEGVSGVFFVVLWRRIWRCNGCVMADFDGVVVVGGGAEEVMWWWVLRC